GPSFLVAMSAAAGQRSAVARHGKPDLQDNARFGLSTKQRDYAKALVDLFPREQQSDVVRRAMPLFDLIEHPGPPRPGAEIGPKDQQRIQVLFAPLPDSERKQSMANFEKILRG